MKQRDLEEQVKEILHIYREIDEKGIKEWLEDIEPASCFEIDLRKTPGFDSPKEVEDEEAFACGHLLVTIQDAMRKFKTIHGNTRKLYNEYRWLKTQSNANPDLVQWVKDYEELHPEVAEMSGRVTMRCIVCGEEFEAKTMRAMYCSRKCSAKANYIMNGEKIRAKARAKYARKKGEKYGISNNATEV